MSAWRPAKERNRERRAALLEEARRCAAVLAAAGATKVVLFGSVACDDGGPANDIDLLVVIPTAVPFVERAGWLLAIIDSSEAVDLFAYTPEEFEAMREGSPLVRRALLEGTVVHEESPRS